MAYIEISKSAFFKNLDYFSNLLGDKSKISIGLKDNAYGHGIDQISSLCLEYGIKHCFVKNLTEASIVSKYSFDSIQVLYDIPSEKTNFSITINSIDSIEKIPQDSLVELKVDTGMHRNGIIPSELTLAIELIKQYKLKLTGVFSHFCCADEDNEIYKFQEKIFLESIKNIKKEYNKSFLIHIANSAGVHKIDNTKYDKARIGIGAYGYIDIDTFSNKVTPIMSLYAQKISTRILNKNDRIGYGSNSFIVSKNNYEVSNYDIGYGDGFFRLSENKINHIENGLPILGRVSMDSFSIESIENTVKVFNDVSRFAYTHQTIVYEILTHLNPYLKRVIVE